MRIVIVDNDQRARRRLKILIYSIDEDYEIVAEASDGLNGLECIEILKPDVVFTDIKIPHMNGLSLIKAAQVMNKQIQFVIISADKEFSYAKQGISLGVQAYLIKPITFNELASILSKLDNKLNGNTMALYEDYSNLYPRAHPLIIKALKVIECSYNARLSQKEIAENLGMTKEYFSYLFHRDIGKTFSVYVREYRINVAKQLLSSEAISKCEVPYQVGFTDPKYFNKVFRQTTGETVGEYKRRKRLS